MRNLVYSNQFKRDIKVLKKRGKEISKLYKVMKMISEDVTLERSLNDHALKGNWKPRRELHISPDWLLIYMKNETEIIFERTGTHSDLF